MSVWKQRKLDQLQRKRQRQGRRMDHKDCIEHQQKLCAEIDRLRSQIEDAEIALNTWDSAHDSEYWLRYPRDPGDHIGAALADSAASRRE